MVYREPIKWEEIKDCADASILADRKENEAEALGKQHVGEITVSKFSEQEVSEMAQARAGFDRDAWGIHQRWNAARMEGVRITHAFKSQKVARDSLNENN